MARVSRPKNYYRSYTEATQAVYDYVSTAYIINMDEWFSQVNVGGKPKVNQTKKSRAIGLYSKKTMKPIKKALHINVFRMNENTFELNWYIM
jgi:hypothetical protein